MELELNLRNLPALPELPIELQQMPFLHKSYLLAQQGSNPNSLECEIKSNKRMEIVGDGKLYGWIADMLVERYPDIGPGSVTVGHLVFVRLVRPHR
jgi:dsRNA-specific ribonuclease